MSGVFRAGLGKQDRAPQPIKSTNIDVLTLKSKPHASVGQVSRAGDAVSLSPSLMAELPLCHLATGHHGLSAAVQGPDHLGSNPSCATAWLCDYLWGVGFSLFVLLHIYNLSMGKMHCFCLLKITF